MGSLAISGEMPRAASEEFHRLEPEGADSAGAYADGYIRGVQIAEPEERA